MKRIHLCVLAAGILTSCSPTPAGLLKAATDWAMVKGTAWVNKGSWTRDSIAQNINYGETFKSTVWQQTVTDRETTIYPVKLILPAHHTDSQGEHDSSFTWTTYFFQDAFGTWKYVLEKTESSPPGMLPPIQ
jgi:hypothetical protein